MKKYAMETMVGIFVVIGLLCIGYMTVKLGHVTLLSDNSYSLFARFTSVSGLRAGNPVDMFGIDVGRVERLSMDQKEQKALVEIRVQKGIRSRRCRSTPQTRRDHHRDAAGCRHYGCHRQGCIR